MVAHFIRLRLTLMANMFRRSVWQIIGYVVAAIYALGLAFLGVIALVVGGLTDPALTGFVVTVVGGLIVLAWWVVPIFAFGVDATLDPQRFVTFGIPRRTLLVGLAGAGLTSLPGLTSVLLGAGTVLAWVSEPVVIPVALVGAVLAVASCVVGSRAISTVLAPILDARRYREVVTIFALIPIILLGPVISTIPAYFTGGGDAVSVQALFEDAAAIIGWTPLGAPWGLASAVHDGSWGLAGARLAIAVVTLVLLWVIWDRGFAKALVTPPAAGNSSRGRGLGWFDRLPATPTGAVMARAMTYWIRDPRYAASLAIIPLMPVLLMMIGGFEVTELLLVTGPFIAWMLGYSISADISFDHTAFALHVSTGAPGTADRAGRLLAVAIPGGVLILIAALTTITLTDRWDLTPMVLGVTFGTLGVSLGVSSVTSARLIYPVPKPGESPLKTPQGSAMAALVSQGLSLLTMFALSIPFLLTAILTLTVSVSLGWVTLAVGPVVGTVVSLLGVRMGGRWYDSRTPEILQQVIGQK